VSPASPVTPLPGDDVGGGGEEEREFVWDDYLEETRSIAAPATSFKHVSNIHTVNSRTMEQFAVSSNAVDYTSLDRFQRSISSIYFSQYLF